MTWRPPPSRPCSSRGAAPLHDLGHWHSEQGGLQAKHCSTTASGQRCPGALVRRATAPRWNKMRCAVWQLPAPDQAEDWLAGRPCLCATRRAARAAALHEAGGAVARCAGRARRLGSRTAQQGSGKGVSRALTVRAKAANGALLDGDHHRVLARQPPDQCRVQRLAEPAPRRAKSGPTP